MKLCRRCLLPLVGPVVRCGCAPQRWRDRRDSYRPADDERFEPAAHEVAAIADDATAKRFVTEHHYSASYPAARFRFGLYRSAELVGVAVFSVPCHPAVGQRVFGGQPNESVELGRFVLLDSVRCNGESWFLARCLAELRQLDLRGVVSFSDPCPRTRADGSLVFPGHLGIIYQASNAVYLGRTRTRSKLLLPDGTELPARAISKVRNGERGADGVARRLEAAGAPSAPAAGPSTAWLDRALAAVTRRQRHTGNHRYCFPLHRALRPALVAQAQSYPKEARHAHA